MRTCNCICICLLQYEKPFSLGSTLAPILGDKINGKTGKVIDAVCLYTLALGMASSLGTSVLNLAGGVNHLSGIASNPLLWAIITAAVTITFILSASSGLMKGIRILSDINMKAFYGIAIFIFIVGPSSYILNLGTESAGNYFTHFLKKFIYRSGSR